MTALPAQSSSRGKQDSISLALSYGAQAMDHLEVLERLLANQKAQTVTVGMALEQANAQVELLERKVAIVEKESFWSKLWGFLKLAGLAAGGFILGGVVGF